jgi:hypothetical protein
VGTGFHPELSARENIYLNGTILGMTRVEIKQKFDEIVAFAEVEKYLDTPVKRYSSGMYVRLAFAVAAHLEPEILVVDEVLAVGDVEFQKKCLGQSRETIRDHLAKMATLPNPLNSDLSRGFTVSPVAEKHNWTEPMVWSQALEGKEDLDRFKEIGGIFRANPRQKNPAKGQF